MRHYKAMHIASWFQKDKRWHIILLVFLFVPLFAWNARWDESANPDAEAAAIAAWQFSQTGTLDLSEYDAITENLDTLNIWFVPGRDQSIVSNRPPGLIGVALPSYAIAGTGQFSIKPSTITAMLMTIISLIIVWWLLRKTTTNEFATVATGVLAVGTTTWAISSAQLWPHAPDQLWAALALAGMSVERYFSAGIAFAFSILTRPITAVFAAVSGLYESWHRRSWRPVVIIGAVSVIGVAVLLIYNQTVFGEVTLRGGYSAASTTGAVERFTIGSYLSNVWSMFFGVPNGFLLMSPVLGVGTFALVRYWKTVPGWARSGALAALGYLLVHAALNRASGGLPVFYRYPLEAITLASVALAVASWNMYRSSRLGARALVVTAVLSVVTQVYYVFFLSCQLVDSTLNTCTLG